jgi:hypothetical protein
MLNIILLIDCNICGQPFDRIATSSDDDPFAWKSLSMDLEGTAVDCGWSFHRSAHYCDHCMPDVSFLSLSGSFIPNPDLVQEPRTHTKHKHSNPF